MNKHEHKTFRLTESDWQSARVAMRSAIESRAAERRMISYSELEEEIRDLCEVTVEAWSPEMNWMLGEVADDCKTEGIPLLTALVTHKTGDLEPGDGFYEKARAIGYQFNPAKDRRVEFWAVETQNCFKRFGNR